MKRGVDLLVYAREPGVVPREVFENLFEGFGVVTSPRDLEPGTVLPGSHMVEVSRIDLGPVLSDDTPDGSASALWVALQPSPEAGDWVDIDVG